MIQETSVRENGSVPHGPEEHEIELRDLWNFWLRNRWTIGIAMVFGLAAAAAFTWRTPPLYQAEASVRIDDDRPMGPMDVFSTLNIGSLGVETEMGVLRSRTVAEDVVDSLQLMLHLVEPRRLARSELIDGIHFESWANAASIELARLDSMRFEVRIRGTSAVDTAAIGEAIVVPGGTFRLRPAAELEPVIKLQVVPYARAVEGLSAAVEVIRPDRAASIVSVRYRSTDSMLVDDVPNLIVSRYMDRRLESQQTGAASTVRFLRGQLDSLALGLTQAEDELQAFREGEQVVSLQAEASAQVTQLARLQADRNTLDAERGALQQLLDGVSREAADRPVRRGQPSPYRRLIAFPSLLQNQLASQLLQSLNTIENERSQLLRRRTMQDPDVESLTSRIEELEEQLRSIAVTYLQGLGSQVASLDRTLSRFGAELARIPAKELAVARLERQTATLREIFMMLQTKLKEAEIAQAAEDTGVRVLDPAVLNPEPVRPRPSLNLLLGVLLGLLGGTAVAAAKDFLDRSVHTREDVEHASGGMPILGVIPELTSAGGNGKAPGVAASNGRRIDGRLVTVYAPQDPAAEAYRALRTSLRFSRLGSLPKIIVMTSALPQDGKSTTAANLAVALAQQGSRTLLVDADLRRGVVAKLFGQPSLPGLSNVIVGDLGSREAFKQVDVGNGAVLHLLTTGPLPPNPAELIASERMAALLRKLEERYDAIVLDTPPLNLVTDAAVLGVQAGGVILVTRASVTEKGAVRHAADVLRGVRAPVLGAVLNGVNPGRDSYYGSAYGSYTEQYRAYYGATDPKKKKSKRGEKVSV